MKFRVTMKTPDALNIAIDEAVDSIVEDLPEDLPEDEQEDKRIDLTDEAKEFASKYFKYGEYIAIEFDTEAKTATVVKQ